jgi:hypothetical protein
MLLLFNADRRLAKLAADAAYIESVGGVRDRPWRRPDQVRGESATGSDRAGRPARTAIDAEGCGGLARAIQIAVVGDPEMLPEALTEDAQGWSPTLAFGSRAEAEAALRDHDSSLAILDFQITRLCWSSIVVFAEWYVEATLSVPLLVGDDVLIDASNRHIALCGATVADRRGDLISAVHTYFDDAALIEQVVLRS